MSQSDRQKTPFVWGTATAAYQIEGAWNVDGKGPSIWDVFSQIPGKIKNNDNGNVACDHYHKFAEDVDIINALGVDAYRLSIGWARLIPDGTGQVNVKGADFYSRLFDALLEKNITPWVTLYHWDLPQALQEKGGWENRDITDWFEEYAQNVCKLYGDRIKNFIVLNEPSITAYLGHFLGVFAPGKKDLRAMYAVTHHQNLVNGRTIELIHSAVKKSHVGSSYTYFPVYPENAENMQDVKAAKVIDNVWTRNFLNPAFGMGYPEETTAHVEPFIKPGDMEAIATQPDYLGINHYGPSYARNDGQSALGAALCDAPDSFEKTDIGWAINPDDFKKSLIEIKDTYANPALYVTENGMCENTQPDSQGVVKDVRRVSYLERYIGAVMDARDHHGCNIHGYFLWSMMDNFEWAEGYDKRFGIVHVDYKTQKRTPKKSYEWYKENIVESR